MRTREREREIARFLEREKSREIEILYMERDTERERQEN